MERPPSHRAAPPRYHFLDVARALLMLLGAPFHAALVYGGAAAGAGAWLVTAPQAVPALAFLAPAISTFRMPGFFLVAGFFAALLLERRNRWDWLAARGLRLGVPLATGMALLVPLQDALLRRAGAPGVHYPASLPGALVSYLWFLPVLLMLCALLAAVWPVLVRLRWPDLPVPLAGALAGLWLVALYGEEAVTHYHLVPLRGLVDVHSVLTYAPFFLFGVAARRNPAVLARLTRRDGRTLAVALVALLALVAGGRPQGNLGFALSLFVGAMAGLCIMQALLSVLARFFDRPSPLVDRLVDASFSIYLFHHPLVVALALLLLRIDLPPLLEWTLVWSGALALSYGLHRLLRRGRLLLFAFNGIVPKAVPPPPRPAITGE